MNDRHPIVSPVYAQALAYASNLHAWQRRKGTEIPYISHLLAVSGLVLEYGGTEMEAIAALLHDSIEDCGAQVEGTIRRMFGDEVAEIILGCTDGTPDESGTKVPWRERKENYLIHLESVSPSVRLVSACDKLHNARSILKDFGVMGPEVYFRFKAGKVGTLWYYRALSDAFIRLVTPPAGELASVVGKLEMETAGYC